MDLLTFCCDFQVHVYVCVCVCQMEMEAGTPKAAESTTAVLTSPLASVIISHILEFFW